jgi:predicted MPP superfamily phosphohydrolase
MSATINWLHLTDWHVGQQGQHHLWPNLRAEFERDLSTLIENHGTIDLVFFTGDLVQSGSRAEYQQLESHLAKLWAFFNSKGCNPQMVSIPGNHDLRRPEPSKSWVLALRNWEGDSEVRAAFWNHQKSDFRKGIEKAFEEYVRWRSTSKIPHLPSAQGLLPGDVAATFLRGEYQIGIVGLNTTFLQLEKGDFESKLAVSSRQFGTMCGADYVEWLAKHHFSVLMTHQPKSWFTTDSTQEFDREIAPPGRFALHLCGHLHQAKTVLISEAGSLAKQTHQGASMFGLEFVGDAKKEVRTHGFLFGQWIIENQSVKTRLWPRIAHYKQGGA